MPGQRARTRKNHNRAVRLFSARQRSALVVVLAAIGTLAAAHGRAQADREVLVALLRPVPTSELLSEAIVRIKSELLAGGFQVTVTDCPASDLLPEPRVLMERAGQVKAPSATLAIFGNLSEGSAELWVVDRITGKAVIRRVEVETSSDRPISEVLAIRAQELLRATLVEVLVEESRPAPPATKPKPDEVAVKQHPDAPSAAWRFGVELGASGFGGWGGIGPTLAPAARLRLAIDERFWIRLTGLGFGTRPRVQANIGSTSGSASVRQDVVLVEGAAWFRAQRLLRPMVSLGLGTLRLAADGTAEMPYQGEHNARWFFAADAGVGIAVRVAAHWEAQLEAHALVAAPRPAVRFFDVDSARVGQPTLLAILTLAGGT